MLNKNLGTIFTLGILLLGLLSIVPSVDALLTSSGAGIETFDTDTACVSSCTLTEPITPAGSSVTVNAPSEEWYDYDSDSVGSGSSTLNVGVRAVGLNSTTNAFSFESGGTTGGQSARFTLKIPKLVTTIELWVSPDASPGGTYASCYIKMGSETAVEQRLLSYSATTVSSVGNLGGAGTAITTTSARVNIIVDWTGKTLDYFKDGVHLAGPVSFTTSTNSGTVLSYIKVVREGGNNCGIIFDSLKLNGGYTLYKSDAFSSSISSNVLIDLELNLDYNPQAYVTDNINLGTDKVFRYNLALTSLGSTVYCDTLSGYHSRDGIVGFAYNTNRKLVFSCVQDDLTGTSFLVLDEDLDTSSSIINDIIGISVPTSKFDAGNITDTLYIDAINQADVYDWINNEVSYVSAIGTVNDIYVSRDNNYNYVASSTQFEVRDEEGVLIATKADAADTIAAKNNLIYTSVFGTSSSTIKQYTQFGAVVTQVTTRSIPMDIDDMGISPDGDYLYIYDNQAEYIKVLNSNDLTDVVEFFFPKGASSLACGGIKQAQMDIANNYIFGICSTSKSLYRADIFAFTASTGGDNNSTTPNPAPLPGTVPETSNITLVNTPTSTSSSSTICFGCTPLPSGSRPFGIDVNWVAAGLDVSVVGVQVLIGLILSVVFAIWLYRGTGSIVAAMLGVAMGIIVATVMGLIPAWVVMMIVLCLLIIFGKMVFGSFTGGDEV